MRYSIAEILFQECAIRQNSSNNSRVYALVQGQRGFRLRAVIYLGVGPENIGPSIQSL